MVAPSGRSAADGDEGSALVVVVAIVVAVLLPATLLFVRSQTVVQLQQQRQTAAVLVGQALADVRSVTPDNLLLGRSGVRLDEQMRVATTAVMRSQLVAARTSAAGDAAPLMRREDPVELAHRNYLVRTFVSECERAGASSGPCTYPVSGTGLEFHRVVVSASWVRSRSMSCADPAGRCAVVATTLVAKDESDPVFDVSTL